MAIKYQFKYMPLVGKLSGNSMVEQTETAINEIAEIVNDNTAQAEIINTLAEEANANSAEALEKATEALETSSRVYITESSAVDIDSYCESQLIYIDNTNSTHIPIAHKGFLEVKTNDDKTQATQVYVDDTNKDVYVRSGAITAETVGDVTTYTASYGNWVKFASSSDLANYLPLAGGTMSGDIGFSASSFSIKGTDINNDGSISILGATSNLNGSSLNLYGANHTEAGSFELSANDSTYTKTLKGEADGDLTWDGDFAAVNETLSGNLTVSGTASGVTPSAGDDSTKFATTEYVQEELRLHASIPIGHEYFSMNPNVPQGSLPLLGGEYDRATYPDLWAWVQDQSGYLKTEAQWQALSTSNNGNVPFYSDGDGSTTFRVPSLKCFVKGTDGSVQLVGSYLQAGLPNITGTVQIRGASDRVLLNASTGSFSYTNTTAVRDLASATQASIDYGLVFDFNASSSSAIYGNSNTVQPESIVGMWLVKAYGTIEDTGTIDEQQYIDDRIAALMNGSIAGNPLTLATNDGNGNLANLVLNPNGSATWAGKSIERVNASGTKYIRYESGLQICWGAVTGIGTTAKSVTYEQPFNATPGLSSTLNTNVTTLRTSSVSATGFSADTTTGSSYTLYYVAVGFWK